MHSGHKAMTGFVAVILALLITIVGLTTRWPLWAWPLSVAALVVYVAVSLAREGRHRPVIPSERQLEPDLPIAPVERWECVVRDIALPSLSEDYDFLFSATIRWLPQDAPSNAPTVNAGGLAVDAVLERARQVTQISSPHRSSLVQHRLNGELATMLPDANGRVIAMAESVQLRLEEADRERLEKLATVRKDEAVWEHERKWEQNKRAYLGDDVLRTPGSAVVWWLAKNDDRIDKTVSDIGLLAELASAAHDQPVPADFHRFVPGLSVESATDVAQEPQPESVMTAPRTPDEYADLLLEFVGLPEADPRHLLFLKRVADDAEAAGQSEMAQALRRRLDRFWTGSTPSGESYASEPPDEENPKAEPPDLDDYSL
ncbi:hypothetical protein ADK57_07595 [Streptomyces sp. MMG1533]|uniref:hypothetical protein n=1 Tax=Streptomyces sp. MMG1533 TaxID=1415546 RepID=UPI0006ADAED7|nr:hypothetical protein [Streptomyces sp. MMG1533]KOU74374.1 hypothetical protein ADK57_07595 [Streptomyces sp. MMG1533]